MKKILKFHQFIRLECGPVFTALYNLLKGDIFQVTNKEIELFQTQQYEEIPELITSLKEAQLIIQVDQKNWIPIDQGLPEREELEGPSIILELEAGLDIPLALQVLANHNLKIVEIHFYGDVVSNLERTDIPIKNRRKDFSICQARSAVTTDFYDIKERTFRFNKRYNSCWGKKIAVTADGSIRPCIYSQQILGHIVTAHGAEIFQLAEQYRHLTKDKVQKCQACEFKWACFDCREIAFQQGGDLYAPNPTCNYDPYQGCWVNI